MTTKLSVFTKLIGNNGVLFTISLSSELNSPPREAFVITLDLLKHSFPFPDGVFRTSLILKNRDNNDVTHRTNRDLKSPPSVFDGELKRTAQKEGNTIFLRCYGRPAEEWRYFRLGGTSRVSRSRCQICLFTSSTAVGVLGLSVICMQPTILKCTYITIEIVFLYFTKTRIVG